MADPAASPRTRQGKAFVEADERPPGRALRESFGRLWRDDRPAVAIPRDIAVVAIVLILVLAGLWTYTGQPFPTTSPLVVVESESMVHPNAPYGRVGTIDPGDLVLVKDVTDVEAVATAYGGGDRTGYGGKGDVLIYRPLGNTERTPIIHRAMTWVEVREVGTDENGGPIRRYTYHDTAGTLLSNEPSVTLAKIGIHGRQFPASGFITKGDNPDENPIADQVGLVRDRLVEPAWIVGVGRGEIPWLGLVKLALGGNPEPANQEGECNVLAAWAPCDTWIMLAASFVVLIGVPFTLDRVARRSERVRGWLR